MTDAEKLAQAHVTLRLMQRVFDEALPKFNRGNSALDANAIYLLNEGGLALTRTLDLLENQSS